MHTHAQTWHSNTHVHTHTDTHTHVHTHTHTHTRTLSLKCLETATTDGLTPGGEPNAATASVHNSGGASAGRVGNTPGGKTTGHYGNTPGGETRWEQWHLRYAHTYHLRRWGFPNPHTHIETDTLSLNPNSHPNRNPVKEKTKRKVDGDTSLISSHFIDCLFDN